MSPPGRRDYRSIQISQHALERFIERFGAAPESAEEALRAALSHARRFGRNPRNRAVAVLAVHQGRPLVAIVQGASCLTILTWPQFIPRLADFGRAKIPRKFGRLLRRLHQIEPEEDGESSPGDREPFN